MNGTAQIGCTSRPVTRRNSRTCTSNPDRRQSEGHHQAVSKRGRCRRVPLFAGGIRTRAAYGKAHERGISAKKVYKKSATRHPRNLKYNTDSYSMAVVRPCRAANALARTKHPDADPDHVFVGRWHPHQLRHNYAEMIDAKFGREAVMVMLGHSNISTAAIYTGRKRRSWRGSRERSVKRFIDFHSSSQGRETFPRPFFISSRQCRRIK